MRSTFFGIDIARRALQTQQRALDVLGHNIANANTPGYSRQVAIQATTPPYTLPSRNMPVSAGQVGTGVHISAIKRVRDEFIDMQLRNETESAGRWEARRDALYQAELIFLEPSDMSLRHSMDQFWQSLQDLHQHPESDAARAVVRERALSLTSTFRHVHKQLEDLQWDLDRLASLEVERINSLVERLADVNGQIHRVVVTQQEPNDLLDRRDQLLLELSELVDIHVVIQENQTASVSIGGLSVVSGSNATLLRAEPDPLKDDMVTIRWGNTDRAMVIQNGRLAGVLEARDELVAGYLDSLNTMAEEVIRAFNEVHGEGYTLGADPDDDPDGGAFFIGTNAEDIDVDPAILQNLNNIAASRSGAPGDGENALALARVYTTASPNLDGVSLRDYFTSLISGIGVASQKATNMVDSQEVLVGHLLGRRDAVSGVSLDEEMVDMIRFQQAYAAAARVVTAMDEILETMIGRMGIVGR